MPVPKTRTDAQALRRDALREAAQAQLLADIPLTRFMHLAITGWDGDSLRMSAPLAPNINDKGCAFGGSLASVMTLACWSLIKLAADERELRCDIYVQDSNVHYLAPVWEDFTAEARLAENQSFDAFFNTLGGRGKARLAVHCGVRTADGALACSLNARFVAMRRLAMAATSDAVQLDSVGPS
jgi:thioesterase domain-containing protein